jgi:hypothetical protein
VAAVASPIQRVLDVIDLAILDAEEAFDLDKLAAARLCLSAVTVPTLGSSTGQRGQRRAFVKWCPKCEAPRPGAAFNRNRRNRDGLQSVCRACQRRIYQEHRGALAPEA